MHAGRLLTRSAAHQSKTEYRNMTFTSARLQLMNDQTMFESRCFKLIYKTAGFRFDDYPKPSRKKLTLTFPGSTPWLPTSGIK